MLLMLEQFLVHRIQSIEELELDQQMFCHEVVRWILEKRNPAILVLHIKGDVHLQKKAMAFDSKRRTPASFS